MALCVLLTADDQLQFQVVELIQHLPSLGEDCHDGASNGLNADDIENKFVHHAFEMTNLLSAHLGIKKDLSFVASIAAQSYDPICVLQDCTFEEKLLVRDRKLTIINCHSSLERAEVLIWLLNNYFALDGLVSATLEIILRNNFVKVLDNNAFFKVLFAIEGTSLNITIALI